MIFCCPFWLLCRPCFRPPDPPEVDGTPKPTDNSIEIEALPSFRWESDGAARAASNVEPEDCSICLSPFSPNDECRRMVNCQHCFHRECVDRWLKVKLHCPLCRGDPSPPKMREPTTVCGGESVA